MQELLSRVQRTSKQMEGDLRRKPTRAELAAHMNVNEGKLEEMYSYLQVWGGGMGEWLWMWVCVGCLWVLKGRPCLGDRSVIN